MLLLKHERSNVLVQTLNRNLKPDSKLQHF